MHPQATRHQGHVTRPAIACVAGQMTGREWRLLRRIIRQPFTTNDRHVRALLRPGPTNMLVHLIPLECGASNQLERVDLNA